MPVLPVSLLLINAAGFLIMYLDKTFARRGRRRIPERTLLTVAALFGSAGIFLGMYLFHHKTRKAKFYVTVPLLLCLQAALLFWYSGGGAP